MKDKQFTIALAGNANVGKSVIFNQLTGGNQIIGNWPGKTVEKAEGYIEQEGIKIRVVDLPGIYSLSTYSEEEIVSREFVAKEKPDLVVNVVDAVNLERNLFFTLQLIELESPLLIALNQYDILEGKGLEINADKLSKMLGVPVVKTVAVQNKGLKELFARIKEILLTGKKRIEPIKYGKEVESRILILQKEVEKKIKTVYPPRFVAIKLLENDPLIKKEIDDKELFGIAEKLKKELQEIHGENSETVIISERYAIASRISESVIKKKGKARRSIGDWFDKIALDKVLGYIFLILVTIAIFYTVFKFGSYFSDLLSNWLESFKPTFMKLPFSQFWNKILWNGVMEGVIAGVGIVLPYIAPFYLILAFLEDSGYLARIAFLTDNLMHKLGLHGKAFMPLIEGFGCNVPAVLGTRIMERDRDRFIAAILATLVPCSARTVIVLGLVAAFLGPVYALIIYVLDFILILIVGRILNKFMKGTPSGLIMEMPRYRKPVMKIILKQTWIRLKDFVYFAFPIIIVANVVMEIFSLLNWITPVADFLKPVMTYFLGLPPLAGITFLFGVLRKELTLVMLSTLYHTTNFASVLTPRQIFIFGFVTMIYIPCVATIAALKREFGWKRATFVTIGEFLGAIVLGGLLNQILRLFMR
jgi:ferrous iron transport protein B